MLRNKNVTFMQYCKQYNADQLFLPYCNNKITQINYTILQVISYLFSIVKIGERHG